MRYARIFLLHFQYVFEHRGRSFIWFLNSLLNPLIILLFWQAAIATNRNIGFSFPFITSYYLLSIIATSVLISHVEEDIAKEDIHQGNLSMYIIRPFSYFWINFFEELPYRLLQGSFGLISLILLVGVFNLPLLLNLDIQKVLLSICIAILAYILSFTFKCIFAFLAFWVIDIGGMEQLLDIVILLLGGIIVPISFLPLFLQNIAQILPFSYMIYYPIIAFMGQLSIPELFSILKIQILWLVVFWFCYQYLWRNGLKAYTGVGQ